MTHEDFSRQEEIKPSSDRSFGLVIATFFLIVGFWPLVRAEPMRWWALGVAAVFVVLAYAGRREWLDRLVTAAFPLAMAALLFHYVHAGFLG